MGEADADDRASSVLLPETVLGPVPPLERPESRLLEVVEAESLGCAGRSKPPVLCLVSI